MSDQPKPSSPDTLDLTSLRLMPDWVANFGSPSTKTYSDRGDDERPERRDRDGRGAGGKTFGRGAGGAGAGPRRDGAGGGARPSGPGGDRPRGDRPRFDRRDDLAAPRTFEEAPQLPTGLKVTVEPEEKAIDMLAQHVKSQGLAFSLFEAARLVLAGPERHRVKVECEAERLVGLFQVISDGALFETREEAVRYLLRNPEAVAQYYSVEEVELEEPKGVFTSVGVCGMSGEVLGPPSHHSYQTTLKRLHTERFSNLPFEEYRRRVRTESTPEMIDKWKEQQRKGTKWTWLKGEVVEGQEPLSFTSKVEFETHFRRTHSEDAVKEVREAIVHATAKREQLSPGLGRVLRRHIEEAKKHLFELSQKIAHNLDRRGLKLFKRRGGKMFVSRSKPRPIESGVVLSPRITAIIERLKAEPGIATKKLLSDLAPSPVAEPGTEEQPKQLTEEQKGLIVDLHWLADEGYIISYSDGVVFLGVQGEPPQHAAGAKAAAEPTAQEPAADAPAPEASVEPASEAVAEETPAPEAEAPPSEEAAEPSIAADPAPVAEEAVAATTEETPVAEPTEAATAEATPSEAQ